MKWIDVRDELPKDDQTVLGIDEAQEDLLPILCYYEKEFYPAGFYATESMRSVRIIISHWMALPKHPNKKNLCHQQLGKNND